MKWISAVLMLSLAACSKNHEQAKSIPPISEKEAIRIAMDMEHSPLTGRSDESKKQLQNYLQWHKDHDSDPTSNANAARLKYVEDYWSVWDNPKRLDDSSTLYQDADKRQLGLGDELRAQALQEQFIRFNFQASESDSFDKREKFIFVWNLFLSEMGPHDNNPIRWVLRTRESVLEERDRFKAELAQAHGWRDRLSVLDAFAIEKTKQIDAANAYMKSWEEMLKTVQRQELDKFSQEFDAANRAKAASNILRDLRERQSQESLRGIEREINSLNMKLR